MKTETLNYSRNQIRDHLANFETMLWQNVEGGIPTERAQFNFLNTAQLFPHALIHRSGPISPLTRSLNNDILDMTVQSVEGTSRFNEFVTDKSNFIDGVIALHKGKVVYESYPGMRPFDKHLWWSVTKVFTGALVAILEERNLIDINRAIDSYVPELSASGYAGVSVRDVVDMCSGIDALEMDDPDAYTNINSPYTKFEGTLGMLPETETTPSSPYKALTEFGRRNPPGEGFYYTSVDTFACSWLIEKILKKPFHEIVREEFWSKIGPENDAMVIVGSDGSPASHGGVSSTLADMARFGLLFTPSWKTVSQEQIISPKHIGKIQNDARHENFNNGAAGPFWEDVTGESLSHNVLQWDFVTKDGDFFKAGWGAQGLYISPARDFVFTFFSHQNAAIPILKFGRQIAKTFY